VRVEKIQSRRIKSEKTEAPAEVGEMGDVETETTLLRHPH
jgi:hypothetical protein